MTIQSHQGSYDVSFSQSPQDLVSAAGLHDSFVIADERVAELHRYVLDGCAQSRIFIIPASEEEKSLAGVERVCRFLQAGSASKTSRITVIGGGILQDIGAFAAHAYYRGIAFNYVPTTLLSMADSCIGAKCGINLGNAKNQLGFFHAPKTVTIWPGFLATLPEADIRSGFGEIVKLAIIAGDEAFDSIQERLDATGFALDGIENVIHRSLLVKQRIIEIDEYESGLRKTLNYGHTFGHALEGLTKHEVPHGLAVAWGMSVANFVAFKSGFLQDEEFTRMHNVIAKYFALPVRHSYAAADLLDLIRRDKKAAAGSVQLILPRHIGEVEIVPWLIGPELQSILEQYVAEFDIFSPSE
jgi:3-dehydroquinate synthase